MAFFDVKNSGSELHFGEGTAKHILTVEEGKPVLSRLTEKGIEPVKMDSPIARSKLDAIIAAAEKGDLHPDTRDFIHTNADAFKHGLATDPKHLDAKKITKIDKLKSAIAFAKDAEGLQAFDEADMKTLRAGLLEHGELGERLMDKEVMNAASIMDLKKDEITRLRADAKRLQELMKRPAGNERLINDLLTRNHADAPALLASVEGDLVAKFNAIHKTDLLAHVTDLDFKITNKATELKVLLDSGNFKTLEENLTTARKGTDKAAIVEAEREMNAAMKQVRELTKTAEGKAAYQLVLKDKAFAEELGNVRKASGQLASHLDGLDSATKAAATAAADAGKGAKWVSGGKLFSFTHTAETVGTDVEKIGKFRGIKAGIVAGAAVVTGMAIAKFANSTGPGERANAVSQGRENEPAMGRA